MFLLYLEATSVSNSKGTEALLDLKFGLGLCRVVSNVKEQQCGISVGLQSKSGQGSLEDHSGGEEFSLKELYAIREIQSQPNLLRLIVQ